LQVYECSGTVFNTNALNCFSSPLHIPVSMLASGTELKDWLNKLGHPELLAPFLSRGFDDVQFLVSVFSANLYTENLFLTNVIVKYQ
jgi:hypothetical protein